ncbi:PIN domain-containing protein [Aminobacter sp. NyZ550]|uniref:type II toxin-antitoxin system VapC family toxin n=1 Tax=Aminobacter sp. NyZ550 TaxID=2979870 RepID=UPI0021D57D9A|nr:PIN domain-containing protein [Aminobacter sp. NyZ550]WAX94419.1 PIN domain-containing protein [Aminobacter sp. NyZ550]
MADLPRVYVDACCFIDMVKTEVGAQIESDREHDVWHLKRLLEANRDREVEIYTSTITIAECQHVGDEDVTEAVKARFSALLMSGQYVRLVEVTPFIAQDARDLRWVRNVALRGADSIHVASALDRRCGEFLSTNGRFARVDKYSGVLSNLGLNVRRARNTILLPSKYRQLRLGDQSNGH